MKRKALFLDRDGVINKAYIRDGKSYPPANLEEVKILDGVKEALLLSKARGFLNIIVTNQPDVATGKQTVEGVEQIHGILKNNLTIDDIFVCLHTDFDACSCRKPLPGLLEMAAGKWSIDFEESFLVGDRWRDIEAAQAVGCRGFFIDYKYEERSPSLPYVEVSSLKEAVEKIYILTQ